MSAVSTDGQGSLLRRILLQIGTLLFGVKAMGLSIWFSISLLSHVSTSLLSQRVSMSPCNSGFLLTWPPKRHLLLSDYFVWTLLGSDTQPFSPLRHRLYLQPSWFQLFFNRITRIFSSYKIVFLSPCPIS